ncbi:MAG: heparan-alpha-glucosaminide N-acetyltransferase domain-containing protein [Vicinamibacterales bacterium]
MPIAQASSGASVDDASSAGSPKGSRRSPGAHASRVIFIDLARAVAVIFMLYGHTIDALLAPAYRSGLIFDVWRFQRGLTSCLFLLLSGFAFSIATARHWASHLTISPALLRRIRRFALFIALGYIMRVPVAPFSRMATADEVAWRTLFGVDVLQLIGVTFIGVQLLVLACRSRRLFGAVALVVSLALMLFAPVVWGITWEARLHPAVAAYLSPNTGSLFPLVPWSAFILIGAALGLLYARWGASHLAQYANRALLLPAAATLLLGLWLTARQVQFFGTSPFAFVPGNVMLRAGACLAIVGVVAHLSRRITQLPHVFGAVAQESLLIYVLHLFIVFGSVLAPGLLGIYGPTRTPLQLLPIIVLLITSMTLAAYAWNWLKHTHGRVAWWASVAVGVLLALRLAH